MLDRFFKRPTDNKKDASSLKFKQEGQEPESETTPPGVDADTGPPIFADESYEASAEYVALKVRLHQQLLEMMNLHAIEELRPDEFHNEIDEFLKEMLEKEQIPLNSSERKGLVKDIVDELLGLGPIEPLIKDPTVSDVLVNTYRRVFVERNGKLEETAVKFKDDTHLLRIIDKIVSRIGRRIDESQPMVDARLPDGSRVNAVIPPVALDGPLLSIRKFAKIPMDMDKLVELGTMPKQMAEILKAVVSARLNIVISGGTGTGKTTLLNALTSYINRKERIVTIEDAAELQLQQPHVARMETRPPNIEGKGEITQRDLVRNSLRMRPDRIILGEVRGGEAFDMLQAMNTGHEGSMTTVHANSCRDALSRLEQMIGMSGLDLPMKSMRGQIASAIHVVLQLHRSSDGRRRLISLHEIVGMESDIITMQEIFHYLQLGVENDGTVIGEFRATGVRPMFIERCETMGIYPDENIFSPDQALG